MFVRKLRAAIIRMKHTYGTFVHADASQQRTIPICAGEKTAATVRPAKSRSDHGTP